MAAIVTWDNCCRLCSEQRSEMLPIFGVEGIRRKIAQKLIACLPVLVYKTDPLPKQICHFCAARLDDAFEFREHCLNVYKNIHSKLLLLRNLESVQIFLDAMKNSPDPCQVQLCTEKARAPPPLVPLPASLPVERSPMVSHDIMETNKAENHLMGPLVDLPIEVEIKEDTVEPVAKDTEVGFPHGNERVTRRSYLRQMERDSRGRGFDISGNDDNGLPPKKEEKRTSILEQVLTGSLTLNDCKNPKNNSKLTSKWLCAPCNSYFRTRESLMKHMQSNCPRRYTCRKCSEVFQTVEELAKHEGTHHLKITLDFDESVKECHQCDREFVSWDMLRHHRLRDHVAASLEVGANSWCPLCNRFFPSVELYHSHVQLHQPNACGMLRNLQSIEKTEESSKESVKRENALENVKSLTCPTCGKVCTQQSALSNHMRTHEPKKHNCEICGKSFGLFMRLAAHKLSEHNQQSELASPVLMSVEQEEALNEEREAWEAQEAETKAKSRTYTEMLDENEMSDEEKPLTKRKAAASLGSNSPQWFDGQSVLLAHLRGHTDTNASKNFTCKTCKKHFKEKWELLKHMETHKRTKTIVTRNTNSKKDKSQSKEETTTLNINRTYHCPNCNKIFFKEISLLLHECTGKPLHGKRRNSSSKNVQKSTTTTSTSSLSSSSSTSSESSSSESSTRQISNVKKYKCTKCNAQFSTSQSRNSHMRIHSQASSAKKETKKDQDSLKMPRLSPQTSAGSSVSSVSQEAEVKEENPPVPQKRTLIRTSGGYRCGVCQSPFVLRELAVAHLRSAHPMMPYQCPYCKKRFTTQYTFTHHIKKEHPDETEK